MSPFVHLLPASGEKGNPNHAARSHLRGSVDVVAFSCASAILGFVALALRAVDQAGVSASALLASIEDTAPSVRLPPGPTTARVLELIREHLDRRGFHDVQIRYARGYEGQRTPTEDPIVQSAIRAAAANGVASQVWPTANAFCPASLFARPPLNIPALWTGLGHGERMHQPEEYIEADGVRKYMHFAVSYLWDWARAG